MSVYVCINVFLHTNIPLVLYHGDPWSKAYFCFTHLNDTRESSCKVEGKEVKF